MFITLEGIEGSGKSTQAQAIHRHLNGLPGVHVVLTREPGGTELGQALREMLLHGPVMSSTTELLLYAADRADHVDRVIRPALDRGSIVICDRYADSTVAYQGYGRGMNLGRILATQEVATGGLVPDLTLWLRLPVKVGLARVHGRALPDRIESARIEFHQQVARGYEALAEAEPHRIVPVDAWLPVPSVTEICVAKIKEKYGK